MAESYTLPECTSKPGYEGIFVTSKKKRAILKNWKLSLKQSSLEGRKDELSRK